MDPSRKDIGNGYYGENRGGDGADQEKAPSKVDDFFEDYMWMANEEEAEKEMLRQIEDEQTADNCYVEMLEEEQSRSADVDHCWQGGQWSSGCPVQGQPAQLHQPWGSSYPPVVTPEDALANNIRSLSVNEKPKVQLNPMAAEFVPGQAFQPASG